MASETVTKPKTAALDRLFSMASRISIVAHIHPDGDAVGSSTALCSYLAAKRGKKDVRIFYDDQYPESLDFLCECYPITIAGEDPDAAADFISGSDLIVCLDMNSFGRAGCMEKMLLDAKCRKVLIDHHLNPEESQFDLVFSETAISSASELLFQVLKCMPEIDGDTAWLPAGCSRALMAGMTTDTNNFANSVFPSTLMMASELLAAGVDRDDLIQRLYNSCRENRVKAIAHILDSKLVISDKGYSYMILDKETAGRFGLREGELEGMVNIPLTIAKVKLSVYLREDDGYYRVSLRSKKGVSANRLASEFFNGGGHEQAAGGRLYFPKDIPSKEMAAEYIEKTAPTVL